MSSMKDWERVDEIRSGLQFGCTPNKADTEFLIGMVEKSRSNYLQSKFTYRIDTCDLCHGSGAILLDVDRMGRCTSCGGLGKVRVKMKK